MYLDMESLPTPVSLNDQVFPQYLVKNSGIICNFKQLKCKISYYKSATRQACLDMR